jgi:hypothetical protein
MRMPWGKYRGEDLAEVPSSYLAWVVEECDLRPALETAVRAELADRFGRPCPACLARALRSQGPALTLDLIAGWYRQLALRHHPDRGGLPGAMVGINAAHDLLLEMVGHQRG